MRNLRVALATACAVVVGWAFTASADIPTSAYVQDGNCPLDLKTSLETYGEDLTELKASRTGKDGTVFWGGFRGLRLIVR